MSEITETSHDRREGGPTVLGSQVRFPSPTTIRTVARCLVGLFFLGSAGFNALVTTQAPQVFRDYFAPHSWLPTHAWAARIAAGYPLLVMVPVAAFEAAVGCAILARPPYRVWGLVAAFGWVVGIAPAIGWPYVLANLVLAVALATLTRLEAIAAVPESSVPLPGDVLVPRPRHQVTHAVTIAASRDQLWPWLVQLGQARGGLYSHDWLENLVGCDIHSVDRLVPELQHLRVGDRIRLVREGYPVDLVFEVAELAPARWLVLRSPGSAQDALAAGMPFVSWVLLLADARDGTRLVSRWRIDFRPTTAGYLANRYALTPVHWFLERAMLRGIRRRAERASVTV